MTTKTSHAIFLGCGSTLNALDVKYPAKKYRDQYLRTGRLENPFKARQESVQPNRGDLPINKGNIDQNEEICSRLGAVVLNRRINCLRITPSRGSKLNPGFFKKKLTGITNWVTAAIQEAPKASFPNLVDVVIEVEKPKEGDPFEMVSVNFDGHENLWDLKFMMMGVKMGRFAGFPKELADWGNKLYVSRDRGSENGRRALIL